jgi:hypothetical protein
MLIPVSELLTQPIGFRFTLTLAIALFQSTQDSKNSSFCFYSVPQVVSLVHRIYGFRYNDTSISGIFYTFFPYAFIQIIPEETLFETPHAVKHKLAVQESVTARSSFVIHIAS